MRKLLLTLLVFISGASTAYSSQTVTVDPARTIKINGVIRNLEASRKKLLAMTSSKAPISILIDSQGGSVIAGMRFIQAMEIAQARGVTLKCVATGMAMSMGIHILASCDKRYVFKTSLLMTHPASVAGMLRLNEEDARVLADQLKFLTAYLDRKLYKVFGVSKGQYAYWYKNEMVLSGDFLGRKAPKFVKVISNIKGASL